MKPYWINKDGYDCHLDVVKTRKSRKWWGGLTDWYLVTIDSAVDPPTLVDRHGRQWTWKDDPLSTDKNSVPWFIVWLFPRGYGEPSAFLHDPAYNGHPLLTRVGYGEWTEMIINQEQADDLIYQGWMAGGVSEKDADRAYRVLRRCGWLNWKG